MTDSDRQFALSVLSMPAEATTFSLGRGLLTAETDPLREKARKLLDAELDRVAGRADATDDTPPSPALERYREAMAERAEIELAGARQR